MSALLNTTVGGSSEFRQDLSQGGTDVKEEESFHRSDIYPLGMGFGPMLVHLSGLVSVCSTDGPVYFPPSSNSLGIDLHVSLC